MNTKNIILIASIIAVLGLLGAVIFGAMDLVTFGLASTSVLGILWGLLNKFDNTQLKMKVDETITKAEEIRTKYLKEYDRVESLLKENKELSTERANLVEQIMVKSPELVEFKNEVTTEIKEALKSNPKKRNSNKNQSK